MRNSLSSVLLFTFNENISAARKPVAKKFILGQLLRPLLRKIVPPWRPLVNAWHIWVENPGQNDPSQQSVEVSGGVKKDV